jgi:8-amino-7-oxononanoate synthase
MELPNKLIAKLNKRKDTNSLRTLELSKSGVDFYSNDYLGFARSEKIFNDTHSLTSEEGYLKNGSTGSRLISGNQTIHTDLESLLAHTHKSESALLYNSGYDANIGFFSCVPQRNDIIFYDELSHASIRDGIRLSNAKAYSFKHNDLENLSKKLNHLENNEDIYIVTESVFSMDGDIPDLKALVNLSKKYNCKLIIDEAHALGVFGLGLVQAQGLENDIFARIITFGKGLGCHGAITLCNTDLKNYLINFSRSFIYTTALPIHSVTTIKVAYKHLMNPLNIAIATSLKQNITYFEEIANTLEIDHLFTKSNSAIQSCIIKDNNKVKLIATKIIDAGFNVKAILYPTVPANEERIRFCIHSYNTKEEIKSLLTFLKQALLK